MKYNAMKYKEIYDNTYNKVENYNFHNVIKDMYVDLYAAFKNGPLLDAGCGEGIHLKRLLEDGYDIFGIELSEICCEKYLQQIPHENIDIVGFSELNRNYNGIICMDVLEHIPYENIDETIASLKKMSNSVLFGIANHSDIIQGEELHLIQENQNWWEDILKKYYDSVYFITDQFDGMFYYFYCESEKIDNRFFLKVCNEVRKVIEFDNVNNNLRNLSEKKEKENKQLKIENKQLELKKEQLAIEKEEIKKLTDSKLNEIYNSKGWKFLSICRQLKNTIKNGK